MQLSNVCGLLLASSHDLTCIQRFKVLSEAERTVALYSLSQHSTQVQLHFFITVLQQMAGPTPLLLSEPGRRGFRAEPDGSQTRQYESHVSQTQVSHAQFPLDPHYQHQRHEPPVASLRLELFFLISRFCQFRRQPKRPCDDPRSRRNQGRQQGCPSHICTGSRLECTRARYMGRCQFTRPGLGAGYSPMQDISVEPRSSRPDTDFSRAALLSALRTSMAVPISTDYPPPWPMAGRLR